MRTRGNGSSANAEAALPGERLKEPDHAGGRNPEQTLTRQEGIPPRLNLLADTGPVFLNSRVGNGLTKNKNAIFCLCVPHEEVRRHVKNKRHDDGVSLPAGRRRFFLALFEVTHAKAQIYNGVVLLPEHPGQQ
jgi:hypothetical protein